MSREWIAEAYRKHLLWHFKYHPRGKHIVNAMLADQLTFGEVDLVFAEAEYYTGRWILGLGSE